MAQTTEDAEKAHQGPRVGEGADQASQLNTRYGAPIGQSTRRKRPFLLELYGSDLGKKYAMAVTGMIMMGYVVAHMVGNLKMYFGAADFDEYAEFLRDIAYPLLPHSGFLWLFRVVLLAALVIHLHAAYALTRSNQRANAGGYDKQDYVAADFAGRTMRWTGIIVLLFIGFHLLDLTFGPANPDFEYGNVYDNVVASFERVPVSIFYIVANLALGFHLYHGGWSLFQSMGWNNPRFNRWRRWFAVAFAAVVVVGNISFPIAVLAGVVG
ncbi:succinate dehydrogenase cytochrome b subunit [soil metagenome]